MPVKLRQKRFKLKLLSDTVDLVYSDLKTLEIGSFSRREFIGQCLKTSV